MPESATSTVDDDPIRATVTRLARPRPGGGHVIERAAILAAGSDSAAIEAWILSHTGRAEQLTAAAAGGLHSPRLEAPRGAPLRFLFERGARRARPPLIQLTQGARRCPRTTPRLTPRPPRLRRSSCARSAAQRRAAESSLGAGRQAELKAEAAERRVERAKLEAISGPIVLGRTATQRRLHPH